MKRYNLIPPAGNKEVLIRESQVRQTVRNAAIALAIIFGSLVLYFSLVPALAENGTDGYIYFDNGLSMYETVKYSTDGINYYDMYKLSEHEGLIPPGGNVNPEYVWVTPRTVTSGTISFRGIASGRVYDTTSNYQISSASREWGYKYENFEWTTKTPITVDSSWNCYFASALAMQYKYNAKNDDGMVAYFIKPEIWAHEEKASDIANAYVLPAEDAPMIMEVPETEMYEAEAYEAEELLLEDENLMEGSVGSVDELTAEEELLPENTEAEPENEYEEEILPEEEEIILDEEEITEFDVAPYADDNGIQVLAAEPDHTLNVSAFSNMESGYSATDGFFTVWGPIYYNTGNNGLGTATDGTEFTVNINLREEGSIDNGVKKSVIQFKPTQAGKLVVYAMENRGKTEKVVWLTTNSQNVVSSKVTLGGYVNDIGQPKRIELNFNTPNIDYYIISDGVMRVYAAEIYYNTGSTTPPTSEGMINPGTDDNRTFYGYKFAMEGKTGKVNEVNDIGDSSQGGDNDEGSYAKGSDSFHGLSSKQYNDAFNAKATFYDYYSDWELTGKPLNVNRYIYENQKTAKIAKLYNEILYRKADDFKTKDGDNQYNGSPILPASDSKPSSFYEISFAEGTNTIAYTYQGDLWNQAIRDYYIKSSFADGVSPLYFGSNSWFTGNKRYDTYDRYGNKWSPLGENEYYRYNTGTRIDSNGDPKEEAGYIYNIPSDRSYIYCNGYNIVTPFDDPSNGISNSRGYPGLVVPVTDNGQVTSIQLTGSDKNTPYFDKDFLRGNNNKFAVYGAVYEDVDFDFKYNEATGYYEYDSAKSEYATRLTLNTATGGYYMDYTGKGVSKADSSSQTEFQFYPFNSEKANADFFRENLMFGMELEIPFVTYTDADRRTGIFKFSGDDDVWVYVDDTLALDMGGTHTAVGGVIDMSTGYAVLQSTFDEKTGGKNGDRTDAEKRAFAIGTAKGVGNFSDYSDVAAEFFDDKYDANSYTCSTRINKEKGLYEVTLNDGSYKFALIDVTGALDIDKKIGENTPELVHHELKIYYMERGLNSSNFKLAFKLADETQRTVEKVWADAGESDVDHSKDRVKLQLYRTLDKIDQEARETVYDFENDEQGWSGIGDAKVSAESGGHGGSGKALKVSDRGGQHWRGAMLALDNSYTAGETYKFSAFAQYRTAGGVNTPTYQKLYENKFDNSDKGAWTARDWGGGTHVDIWTSGVLERSALGVGKHDNCTGRTRSGEGVQLNLNNITLLDGTKIQDGAEYSFSVYVRHPTSNDYQPVNYYDAAVPYKLSLQYDISGQTEYETIAEAFPGPGEWGELKNTNYPIPKGATNLILYVETDEERDNNGNIINKDVYLNNFYITDFVIATAGAKIEGTDITNNDSSGGDYDESAAPKLFKITIQYGLDESDYEYVTSKAVKPGEWIPLSGECTLPPLKDGFANYNLIIETQQGNAADFYIDDVKLEIPATFKDDVWLVSEIELDNDKHCNDDIRSWYHKWKSLLETNDGKKYTYFIREEAVNLDGSNDNVKDKSYQASYYNSKGEKIEPSELMYKDNKIRAYRIDDEIGITEIVNNPLIELKVCKEWIVGNSYPTHDITINVYNDQGKQINTVTLTETNDWTASLSNLPKYRRIVKEEQDPETGESKNVTRYERIKYYGVEIDPDTDLNVEYTPNQSAEINDMTVYLFDEDKLSLTVRNIDPNMKVFGVKILKSSALDENAVLANVAFELYDTSNGADILKDSGKTGADGILGFSGLEPGKTYKIVETQSALGYKTDKTPIIFTVVEDGGDLRLELTSPVTGGILKKYELKKDTVSGAYVLELDVQNQPYTITMPSTGGGGIVYLFAGAIGMMIMSLILLTFADRRRNQ